MSAAALIAAGTSLASLVTVGGAAVRRARRRGQAEDAAALPAEEPVEVPAEDPDETPAQRVVRLIYMPQTTQPAAFAKAQPVSEQKFLAAAVASFSTMARLGEITAKHALVRAALLPEAGERSSGWDAAILRVQRQSDAQIGAVIPSRADDLWTGNLTRISMYRALGRVLMPDLKVPDEEPQGFTSFCGAHPRKCRVGLGDLPDAARKAFSRALRGEGFGRLTGSPLTPFIADVNLMPDASTWLDVAFQRPILYGGGRGQIPSAVLPTNRAWVVTRVPGDDLRPDGSWPTEFGLRWMFDPKFVFYASFVHSLVRTIGSSTALWFAYDWGPHAGNDAATVITEARNVLREDAKDWAKSFAESFDDDSGGRAGLASPVNFARKLTDATEAVWINYSWWAEAREPSWLERNIGAIMRYVVQGAAAVATGGVTLPASLTAEVLARAQAYAVDSARAYLLREVQELGGNGYDSGVQVGFDDVLGVADVQVALTGAGAYAITATADGVRVVGTPDGSVRVVSVA